MKKHNRYIVFGGAMNGKTFYKKMHTKIDIVGFSDNNRTFQGTNILFNDADHRYSVPCIPPADISKNDVVIVATAPAYYSEISNQLHSLQLECISVDQFVYDYFADKIKYVEENCLLNDVSRKIYRKVMESRKNNDWAEMRQLRSPNQYFALPEFVNSSSDELFIDAGSYCGDLLDIYINSRGGLFKKIYAFEPGPKQFAALQCRAKRLRNEWALNEDQIVCVNGAISDYNGYCTYEVMENNLASSRMSELRDGHTPVYKLDDFLSERVDFIKADIEGREMELLRGARKLIQKYRPKLAICLYHTPFDMFEIPIYLKEIMPEYKMEIRHHTYNASETVLYAYI